ncbi:caprin-2-like [Patiria miniata]|uniref:C1q domain-containing protein n=1 Tax=Patiria miniata TaxID=46514 RepID=A0A914BLU4_PATMI|nr:caprin-2-like [Patiria miniata]
MGERGTPGNPGDDGIGSPGKQTATLLPGTSFDLETGTFTCSVSGTYVFMFSMSKYPSSSSLYVLLRKNDDPVITGLSRASHWQPMSGSAVLVLQQGDTVYLTMSDSIGPSRRSPVPASYSLIPHAVRLARPSELLQPR